MGDNNSIYMTLAFAGVAMMAAMVVGIVVIRRRGGRHPHHQVRLVRSRFKMNTFVSLSPTFSIFDTVEKHFPYTPVTQQPTRPL